LKSEENKKKDEKKAKKDVLSVQNRINVRNMVRRDKDKNLNKELKDLNAIFVEKKDEEVLKKEEEEKKEEEPEFFELENPCRIL